MELKKTKYFVVALVKTDGSLKGYLRPRIFTPDEYDESFGAEASGPKPPEGWHYERIHEFDIDIMPGCG